MMINSHQKILVLSDWFTLFPSMTILLTLQVSVLTDIFQIIFCIQVSNLIQLVLLVNCYGKILDLVEKGSLGE